jgi:hypothetical protein
LQILQLSFWRNAYHLPFSKVKLCLGSAMAAEAAANTNINAGNNLVESESIMEASVRALESLPLWRCLHQLSLRGVSMLLNDTMASRTS